MTDLNEILKAKAEAVRAMADAIGAYGKNLDPRRRYLSVFAENWAQAIESMVPAEGETGPGPGYCATCGGEHSTDGIYAGKRITRAELTARLGLPEHEQEAVFSWTGELDRYHTWSEDEVPDLIKMWKNDAKRIEREG